MTETVITPRFKASNGVVYTISLHETGMQAWPVDGNQLISAFRSDQCELALIEWARWVKTLTNDDSETRYYVYRYRCGAWMHGFPVYERNCGSEEAAAAWVDKYGGPHIAFWSTTTHRSWY